MRYVPHGVCSREISFGIEEGKVKNVKFFGSCPGNSTGVAKLVEGMEVDEVIARLEGIHCGMRHTSCPDQFACALKEYKKKQAN